MRRLGRMRNASARKRMVTPTLHAAEARLGKVKRFPHRLAQHSLDYPRTKGHKSNATWAEIYRVTSRILKRHALCSA